MKRSVRLSLTCMLCTGLLLGSAVPAYAWLDDVPTLAEAHAARESGDAADSSSSQASGMLKGGTKKQGKPITKAPVTSEDSKLDKKSSQKQNQDKATAKPEDVSKSDASSSRASEPEKEATTARELTTEEAWVIPDTRPTTETGTKPVDPLKPPVSTTPVGNCYGEFTGSNKLVQFLYHELDKSPDTIKVPKKLFSTQDVSKQLEELGDAIEEAVLQNPRAGTTLNMTYNTTSEDDTVTLKITYAVSDASTRKAQATAVRDKARAIVQEVSAPRMTQLEKATALYNRVALTENVKYDFGALDTYKTNPTSQTVLPKLSAYGALANGSAICPGFAQAYKALCDEAKIPCIVVFGKTNQFGINHAWCRINVDGHWRTVDPTNLQLNICKQTGIFIDDATAASALTVDLHSLVDSEAKTYL